MAKETKVRTWYYQQFDANQNLEIPGEGYGGWKTAVLPFDLQRTGFVFMHAWDCGMPEQDPAGRRVCEYLARADKIVRDVFPGLLGALRSAGLKIYHIAGFEEGLGSYAGYKKAGERKDVPPANTAVPCDNYKALQKFREQNVFPGGHNLAELEKRVPKNFTPQAKPVENEGIALNGAQLAAMCAADGVNHLIYSGFAINWCLLMSPGGMLDMSKRGFMCSTIRQAVTAVENKESARAEAHKEEALWRVALNFGFVFDAEDIIAAVRKIK